MLKIVDDLIPPTIMAAIKIAPTPVAITLITALGYVAYEGGASGDFAKNLGISMFPWLAKSAFYHFKTQF